MDLQSDEMFKLLKVRIADWSKAAKTVQIGGV